MKAEKNIPNASWGDQIPLLLNWVLQSETEFSRKEKAIELTKHLSFGSLSKFWIYKLDS